MAVIKQYYPDRQYVLNQDQTGLVMFNRLSVEDVLFKIAIKESAATAAYQTNINDTLEKLLSMGAINIMQYLRNVKLPFAEQLLQSITEEQQQQMMMQQEQQMQAQQPQQQPQQAEEEQEPDENKLYPYGGGSENWQAADQMLAL